MSGGKYTTESATFELIITPALLGALIKCGTEAVSEAGKAIEYQKLLEADKAAYVDSLKKQQKQNQRFFKEYEENLRKEIVRLERELERRGIRVGKSAVSLEERIRQLHSVLNGNSAISNNANMKVYYALLTELESTKEYFEKICETADQIILGKSSHRFTAEKLKKQAGELIETNNRDILLYKQIFEKLCRIMPEARKEQERENSLKQEYMLELARAKALCHITNTLILYPTYSSENAEQVIIKLKEISKHQIELIERIKSTPALHMNPEKREKACEVVANKICAALVEKGIHLKKVNIIENSRVCYYFYDNALLKVCVTNTGIVTFEVVGDPEKKSGFTNYDKQRVLSAMEHFKNEYPELQEQLSKNNVVLTLQDCVEPSEGIVTYEKPEILSAEQRAENEAAVLAMLHASEQVRYIEGT